MKLSLRKAITVAYTLVVIFACTLLGHIRSNLFGTMQLTIVTICISPFCVVAALFSGGRKIRITILGILFFAYTMVYAYGVSKGSNSINGYLAFISLYACAYLGGKYTFDEKMARKWIEVIATVATVLLMLQWFFHLIGAGHLQMVPLSTLSGDQNEYICSLSTGYAQGSSIYRPSAFFLEPSHYVQFTIIALISKLFSDGGKKSKWSAVFLTIGIIATISSTGLLLLIISWGLWGFTGRSSKIPTWLRTILISAVLVATVLMFLSSTGVIGQYIRRVMPTNLLSLANEQEGRFWANRYLNAFSIKELILGRGIGTAPAGYFMGYTRIIYQSGYLGLFSFLAIVIWTSFHSSTFSKYIGLLYIVLLFGAEFDVYRYIITYMTLVFCGYNCDKRFTKTFDREIESMETGIVYSKY